MPEWRQARLADVAEIRSSNVDKKSTLGEQLVRLCNYLDVYTHDYITDDIPFMDATASAAELHRFRIEPGDVLITKDSETPDDIGVPAVVVDDVANLVCGYHVAILKPDRKKIDPIYLSKQLATNTCARYFGRLANGSTRYGLTHRSMAGTPILLAPLDQQQKIAAVLVSLDEAIEHTEALIAKTKQIKAGLMHDLFSRGVTPDGHLRPTREQAPKLYKESPLGWIPMEWEISCAAAEFDITSGITLGQHRRPKKNPHPYLRVANVYAERLDIDEVALLEAGSDITGKLLAVDDLLVVEGHANPGEIGRCALATLDVERFTFQNHLFRLRCRRTLPAFAMRWLNGPVVRAYWLRTCSTSSGLNTINRTKLGAAPIVVPSLKEQTGICSLLGRLSDQLDTNKHECAKLLQMKSGLMHDLLSGRVRVPVTESSRVAARV